MSWKEGVVEIYKNFIRDRGLMLIPMILFMMVHTWVSYYIIFYSLEGIMAWPLFITLICAWVFAFPAIVYLIDSHAKSIRPLKLSEIKAQKDAGCDGFN